MATATTHKSHLKAELHKAAYNSIVSIGYTVGGFPKKSLPVIAIDQIEQLSEYVVKNEEDYELTFLIEVQTREASMLEAYGIMADIRENLEIEIENFTLQELNFEACTSAEEVDQEGVLQREIQRVRVLFTKI